MKLGPYDLDTIITGDARELARDVPDESVDLICTDPPFGIGFKYNNGYKDDPDTYDDLIKWLVTESNRIIKPGGLCFVYVAQLRLRHILSFFPEGSRVFAACKNFTQYRPVTIQFGYDPVIFWQKEGEPLVSSIAGRRDWHIGNTALYVTLDTFHSCPRPLNTIEYFVNEFCPINGIVLDFFFGSGTLAVASKKLNRHYLGFEIDPTTADLARKRVAMTQPPLPLEFVPRQLSLSGSTFN